MTGFKNRKKKQGVSWPVAVFKAFCLDFAHLLGCIFSSSYWFTECCVWPTSDKPHSHWSVAVGYINRQWQRAAAGDDWINSIGKSNRKSLRAPLLKAFPLQKMAHRHSADNERPVDHWQQQTVPGRDDSASGAPSFFSFPEDLVSRDTKVTWPI